MEDTQPLEIIAQKKPLKLKTIAARALEKSAKNDQDAEEKISKLPEELQNYYSSIHKLNIILENISTAETAEKLTDDLSNLISQFRSLLFKVIESESPHIELCLDAIAQYFDLHNEELTDQNKFIGHIKMANLILQIFLEPAKIQELVADFIGEKNASPKKINGIIEKFFIIDLVLKNNLTVLMELLLRANIFSKKLINKLLLDMIYTDCSHAMIRIITNNALASKETVENIIRKGLLYNWINKGINSVKLLFDKIEKCELNVRAIINYDTYNHWNTLLNKAIYSNNPELVDFLLSKGADPSNCDALSWAIRAQDTLSWGIRTHEDIRISKERLIHETSKCIKILNLVLQALLVNRNEEKEQIA